MSNILEGKVFKGRGLGSELGFSTINIQYEGVESGVFAGRIFLKGQWRNAAVHVGSKPTLGDDESVVEAYILEWQEELNGQDVVKIELVEKIRNTRKFENIDDLKKQIEKDVEMVKQYYYNESD